jgi:hypothetical protein
MVNVGLYRMSLGANYDHNKWPCYERILSSGKIERADYLNDSLTFASPDAKMPMIYQKIIGI